MDWSVRTFWGWRKWICFFNKSLCPHQWHTSYWKKLVLNKRYWSYLCIATSWLMSLWGYNSLEKCWKPVLGSFDISVVSTATGRPKIFVKPIMIQGIKLSMVGINISVDANALTQYYLLSVLPFEFSLMRFWQFHVKRCPNYAWLFGRLNGARFFTIEIVGTCCSSLRSSSPQKFLRREKIISFCAPLLAISVECISSPSLATTHPSLEKK